MTLAQKVLARAANRDSVRLGEIVTARVDLAFAHDSSGPRRWAPLLDQLGAGVWDPRRLAIVSDHYVPAVDGDSAEILKVTREFAARFGVRNFFDMIGICHVVLPEHGLIRPGAFIAGGDSHTPTAGAFGALAIGFGATDMAAVVATGETWLPVPDTLRVEWSGRFSRGVVAKDVMLFLCRTLGLDNAFKVIEYGGATVDAMSMPERMVLCNMAAELGCDSGVVAPDRITFEYLAAVGAPVEDEETARGWASDHDAPYAATSRFDATALAPQIALPDSPAQAVPVEEVREVSIDQAYIGACVGAKLSDLHMAAEVLRGRRVASGVRLLVAPASARTLGEATVDGTLATLLEAGAILLPSGCGACAGLGAGVLAAGETCISSTNRNFRGRMGHAQASVYLGSPYSVAAAAAAGRIVDPRELLSEHT